MIVDAHPTADVKLTSSTTSVMRDNVANRLMAFFQRLILCFCRIAVHDKKSKCAGKVGGEVGRGSDKGKGKRKGKGAKVAAGREGDGGKGTRRVSEETGETVTSDGGNES